MRSAWLIIIAALMLNACSAGSSAGKAPERVATPEEARRLYPELYVPVTRAPPPPWCRFISVVKAPGEDPAGLKRPAADRRANYVVFLGEETALVSCGMHCMHQIPVQIGYAYWCPPPPPPAAPAPQAPPAPSATAPLTTSAVPAPTNSSGSAP